MHGEWQSAGSPACNLTLPPGTPRLRRWIMAADSDLPTTGNSWRVGCVACNIFNAHSAAKSRRERNQQPLTIRVILGDRSRERIPGREALSLNSSIESFE